MDNCFSISSLVQFKKQVQPFFCDLMERNLRLQALTNILGRRTVIKTFGAPWGNSDILFSVFTWDLIYDLPVFASDMA